MNTKKEISVITIEGIFESLDRWREKRGLQHTVGNIAANIGEEIVEYLRAENDEERVDALCDMFVFSVNALYASDKTEYDYFTSILYDTMNDHFDTHWFFNITQSFSHMCIPASVNLSLNTSLLRYIAKYAMFQIHYLKYDFLIAMDETLKEIHSRTGAMNEATGKWEKFKTPEAKALWYTANYAKAKIA